jgi:hypothetical protein
VTLTKKHKTTRGWLGLLGACLAFTPPAGASAQLKGPVISDAARPEEGFYKPIITQLFGRLLLDPESARYEWSEPYQMTCRKGVYHTPDRWRGWAVDIAVNARNTFGGYTGSKPYTAVFTTDGDETYTNLLDGTVFWTFKSCRREAW